MTPIEGCWGERTSAQAGLQGRRGGESLVERLKNKGLWSGAAVVCALASLGSAAIQPEPSPRDQPAGEGAELAPNFAAAPAGAFAGGAAGTPDWDYTIAVAADLTEARVRLCVAGGLGERLVPQEGYCASYVDAAEVELAGGEPVRVRRSDGGIPIPEGAGRCASMDVDLAGATRGWDGRTASRSGRSLVVSPDLLLWHPPEIPEGVTIRARFILAEGQGVSAPWPRDEGGAFAVPPSSFLRQTRIAVGAITPRVVAVPGATLEVAILDGHGGLDADRVAAWLGDAGRGVALVNGSFPRERVQVLVQPVRSPWGPVPFGKSIRGGGPAIQLFVSTGATLDELKGDWVAIHEMSHLLHPFVDFDDAWLSEGLATWYQEVVRARAGHQTPREAWQALSEGFDRGRAQTGDGRSLRAVASDLSSNHKYMRVYWSGAAFALLADLRLRERGDGWSLDRALAALGPCCGDDARMMSSAEVASALDRATGGGAALRSLHDRIAEGIAFPDLSAAYKRLGLMERGGRILLDEAAESAAIRRQIMAVQAPAPPAASPTSPAERGLP